MIEQKRCDLLTEAGVELELFTSNKNKPMKKQRTHRREG